MSEQRRGVMMGVTAYLVWGFLPLYWPLLRPAGAAEILAHRIVWSLLFVGLLLASSKSLRKVRQLSRRRLAFLAIASCFIGMNWGVYIWAVTQGHVVETALGYFINPLVTVMLGVVVLRESLRRAQWVAIVIAAIGVAVLTIDYGRLPWIAIVLASTFAIYGLVKKQAAVAALEGLVVETAILVVPALLYLVSLEARDGGTFGHVSWMTSALLVSAGVVTAVPLLAFAGAANRIPLSTIGPLQYIAPTLQFFCGVLVFREAMPPSRWLGFVLVWTALAIFLFDGVLGARSSVRETATAHARTDAN